jgi:hypothetical protein
MTSFKRFESKPVVKIILIYDRLNLWHHLQFITIFYQFLQLYDSFLTLANARGKTSWHKDLPVVKTIYTYGFHEYFLNIQWNLSLPNLIKPNFSVCNSQGFLFCFIQVKSTTISYIWLLFIRFKHDLLYIFIVCFNNIYCRGWFIVTLLLKQIG